MTVVNASVWVSALMPTDAHHPPSSNWLRERILRRDLLAVPSLALTEAAGSISGIGSNARLGLQAAGQLLLIPSLQIVQVDEALAMQGAQVAAEYRLRGADAIYVATARRLGMPLISWDREQIDRGGRLIPVSTP